MAQEEVVRPVVRAFSARFEREAARHVRAGGHAVVWRAPGRGRLVFLRAEGPLADDLGYWSLLDLSRTRFDRVKRGPLRGLSVSAIPDDCIGIVEERVFRDSVHPGSTRTLVLDCEACAACCRKNRVELDRFDFARFRRGGRIELTRPPYARKDGRKIVLRLLQNGDCRHLQEDNRCGIYPLRPNACRTFPMGSEGCLYSREEELGIYDGARA